MAEFRERAKGFINSIEDFSALDGLSDTATGWVQRATGSDTIKSALSGTWLGHQLHPVLTDLPIGAWMMASALDVTAGSAGAPAARRLVGLGVLAALPTAASGASDWADTYGAEQRVGLVHGLSNLAATLLQVTSWEARRRGQRLTGVALSGAGLGIAVGSSYLGGHLTLVRGVGVNHTAFEPAVTNWTDVAAASSLNSDTPMRVTASDVPVVLVQHDGAIHALSATCVHAGGPLDEGKLVEDGCIRCPWHGSTFRLADGTVVRGPAAVDQPSWEAKVENDRVYVRSSPPKPTG
jgi:nitrite reductase/ring-hydroxylating ferredoxin subunit